MVESLQWYDSLALSIPRAYKSLLEAFAKEGKLLWCSALPALRRRHCKVTLQQIEKRRFRFITTSHMAAANKKPAGRPAKLNVTKFLGIGLYFF